MATVQPDFECPCGGGQSCIVDRRRFQDWVHEDDVYRAVGVPVREHCLSPLTNVQIDAMQTWMRNAGFPETQIQALRQRAA